MTSSARHVVATLLIGQALSWGVFLFESRRIIIAPAPDINQLAVARGLYVVEHGPRLEIDAGGRTANFRCNLAAGKSPPPCFARSIADATADHPLSVRYWTIRGFGKFVMQAEDDQTRTVLLSYPDQKAELDGWRKVYAEGMTLAKAAVATILGLFAGFAMLLRGSGRAACR